MSRPHASLVVALALLVASPAAAQQLVVADVTYAHSATTTFDSHYRVDAPSETPTDLTSPIDYASGEAVVRLEVFTKPSDAGTRFQICFEARPTYACTDQAPPYTTTGVYTWSTSFEDFYQGDMVDWTQGLGRIALILKDTMNNKPSPENVGEEESARYMPTSIRVTVTLVPPGETYEPPADTIDSGVPPIDAGHDAGVDAAASELDASARDAGPRTTFDVGVRDHVPPAASGGCSVSQHASSGATLAVWALVGLACAVRRRRVVLRMP